jgi:hypothetical protein
MLEFFAGAGLGALYVEVLYRLFKKGTGGGAFYLSAKDCSFLL